MTLPIIQGVIFVSYITFLLIKFKHPLSSISDSWYELKGWHKQLFVAFCWSIGFLMSFQADKSLWFFFSGAGLLYTGAAANFKDKMTGTIHSIGAYSCIILAFVGISITKHTFILDILFILSYLALNLFKAKNRTWWIEIIAFVLILTGLLI